MARIDLSAAWALIYRRRSVSNLNFDARSCSTGDKRPLKSPEEMLSTWVWTNQILTSFSFRTRLEEGSGRAKNRLGMLSAFTCYLGHAGILAPSTPCDDDAVPFTGNADVTRAIEKDHRARVLVDSGFVRNFFYVDIEDGAGGKIDGLGVHQVAFEEKLDPTAVVGNPAYDNDGVFDRVKNFVAVEKSVGHAIDL